jgi:hypothetical protein
MALMKAPARRPGLGLAPRSPSASEVDAAPVRADELEGFGFARQHLRDHGCLAPFSRRRPHPFPSRHIGRFCMHVLPILSSKRGTKRICLARRRR